MTDDEAPLWKRDEARFIDYRTNYLERQTDLIERKARVLAYSEIGYSSPGIAKEVDHTESTVAMYLDEIAVRFGEAAIHAKYPDDIAVDADPDPVTRGEVMDYPEQTREWWLELAEEYRDVAPEWFADTTGGDVEVRGGSA